MPFLTKQFKFCAAHQYWNNDWDLEQNTKIFGNDINIHGHNYILDITVVGKINPSSGFIIDIMELKNVVENNIINQLDHSQIEKDIQWFKGKQPSTENLVLFIWEQIHDKIPNSAKLYKIKLRETPTIFTEYYGPED